MTMKTISIDGATFLAMAKQGAARLFANRQAINDLNVFPIPDGDTGDNMYMTISSGCQCGSSLPEGAGLGDMAGKISSGMLLGARGNSGVILSRIFAGIAKGLADCTQTGVDGFSAAMGCGVKEAYGAVSSPVEGTILTVLRESVESASSDTFEGYFESLVEAMKISLDHTPDKLAVLREAGVVDSGGAGMLCIAEGMGEALRGVRTDVPQAEPQSGKAQLNLDNFGPDTPFDYGYCTEFLLRLRSDKVDIDSFDERTVKDYLCSVGESVVCFRDGSIIKVHVHTRTPGDILSHVQRWGEFLSVKIENMTLQHSEVTIQDNFQPKVERESFVKRKKYGVVAVASGAGLISAFREAGVDCVIEGGQTMNPAARDFIDAFDRVGAETIFVFPNNSNIIMTAQQAASMYKDSEIVVIPSKDPGAGYVAAAALDTGSRDTDLIRQSAVEAMDGVTTALVSRANRSTLKNGIIVREGDYIGFAGGEVLCTSPDRNEAALKLASKLNVGDHDVAIVFSGCDTGRAEADGLCKALQDANSMTEIINNAGDQPVYDYIIVLC